MKRKIALFVTILSLALVMLMPLQAADLDLVYDEVGLLEDDEYFELNELAQNISQRYQCEVSILIIEDKGNNSAKEAAKSFYEKYNYGYGQDKSGLMLFISMEDRDNSIIAYGEGNVAFTDHGKDVLREEYLLPKLSKDQYYQGFLVYLRKTAEFLQMAEDGTPFDIKTSPWIKWAIFIFAPLLIAGAVCFTFLSQMKTAVSQRAADSYIPSGGFNLTMQADQFLYRTEIRTKIEKDSSRGGSSTDSDGYSSSSGKF